MENGGWRMKSKNMEKAEHPRDSAELKGETNVWPREGNRSVAEQCGNCGESERFYGAK